VSKTFGMPLRSLLAPAVALACAAAIGCGGTAKVRPYPEPSVDDVLSHIRERHAATQSFQSESVMDYWVKKDRVKGTVLLLGKPGSRLRFNAENPNGGTVAADLACDGTGYQLIDYNNNCQMTGPCTRETIADFLNVELDPDDFYLLATGSTPIIPDATGTLTWDSKNGHEKVSLESKDGTWRQEIVLDAKDRRWDVLSSIVKDRRGNTEWTLENKEFHDVKDDSGAVFRVPSKTKFKQPKRNADLAVVWKKHRFNIELGPEKFTMNIPDGLAYCQ